MQIALDLHYRYQAASQPSPQSPIVMMLHGYGSHENDLYSLKDALPPQAHYLSVRAPHDLGMGAFAWYALEFDPSGQKLSSDIAGAQAALQRLRLFVRDFRNAYQLQHQPLWLLGFSQGCILSYAYALNFPAQVQKVIALSGYMMGELQPGGFDLATLRHLEFFVSHGQEDPIIPVSAARMSTERLEQLGIAHQYREYPAPHGLHPQNVQDLKSWFFERLGSEPAK